MKLDRLVSGVCAAAAVASLLACGCSSSTTLAAKTTAQQQAALEGRIATTELMSAQLAGPAPKVGKAHLAVEDDTDVAEASDELGAPKEARRSDTARRGGDFGTTK
jgi:hypothetical protein